MYFIELNTASSATPTIVDPAFFLIADLDPVPDPGFWRPKN